MKRITQISYGCFEMRTLFLIFAIIGAALAGDHHELLEKYGLKKILESCFGKEVLKQKLVQFYAHTAFCKNETGITSSSPIRKAFDWDAVFNNVNKAPIFLPVPVVSHGYRSPFTYNNRQKRHTFFDEHKLRNLKNKYLEKRKLTGCILQRMDILGFGPDMAIKWNEVERKCKDIDAEPALKTDLLDVFNNCKNKVSCLPINQKKLGTFPIGLKQALLYFKCEKKYMIEACMKKDFRDHPDMFELEGLDGLFDHFEEDDDKMLKVMKIFQKFGDDDMDLFD